MHSYVTHRLQSVLIDGEEADICEKMQWPKVVVRANLHCIFISLSHADDSHIYFNDNIDGFQGATKIEAHTFDLCNRMVRKRMPLNIKHRIQNSAVHIITHTKISSPHWPSLATNLEADRLQNSSNNVWDTLVQEK